MAEAKRSSRINELENESHGLEFLLKQLEQVEEPDIPSFLSATHYVSRKEVESALGKVRQSLLATKGESKGEQAELEEKTDPAGSERFPLLNVPDNMLTPEQLKKKKRQMFLKTTSEGRQRAKQKRHEKELDLGKRYQQDEKKLLDHTNGNNFSGNVGHGERLNAAQRERMRLLTTAVFDRGKGDDTFGAIDEDWQLTNS